MTFDPWGAGKITDYEHAFKKFGLEKFDKAKFPIDHYLFRRNLIIAHRDFGKYYDRIKSKKTFPAADRYCVFRRSAFRA